MLCSLNGGFNHPFWHLSRMDYIIVALFSNSKYKKKTKEREKNVAEHVFHLSSVFWDTPPKSIPLSLREITWTIPLNGDWIGLETLRESESCSMLHFPYSYSHSENSRSMIFPSKSLTNWVHFYFWIIRESTQRNAATKVKSLHGFSSPTPPDTDVWTDL